MKPMPEKDIGNNTINNGLCTSLEKKPIEAFFTDYYAVQMS